MEFDAPDRLHFHGSIGRIESRARTVFELIDSGERGESYVRWVQKWVYLKVSVL